MLCPLARARSITERDRNHWAFQPIKRLDPPALRSPNSQTPHSIDRFILARLETNGLALSPRASKEQLIRRVAFGLIGLPPTPEEIDAFANDSSADAYEKLIDRLLASPHYGERWGRHWLDLARFAESDGFEHDAVRPHSWRYRDYVINSFNADKPYDQFIREQLAGDELFPDKPEALIATSFNLLGPDMVDSADQIQRRHNTLNDMTDTAALVFLGQTLGCARCHNHKSEPFSQKDYYQLQAFFTPAKFQREFPVPTAAQRKAYEAGLAKHNTRTEAQRKQIEAIEAPHRGRLHDEKLAKLSEEAQLAHKTPKERRTVEMENQIQETADLLKITDAELVKAMSAADKARRKELLDELKKFPKPTPLPLAMALQSDEQPVKTFVLGRGDYNDPRDEVQPAFPEIVRGSRAGEAASKRTALANWIASPDNPLTARVMVNRIWQHHFGRGIAPMPSEFGTRAEPPTHPELLDWLASEFIAQGWSIKQMHKLILLSEAYRQSSQPSGEALARDPENKFFSRQNRVRLEGEAIRDSLLAISGRLNPKIGGPSVFPPIPADITKTSKNWTTSTNAADHARRSLYVFSRRNLRFPFLEVFDAPDSNLSCAERGRSTTAPQSLTLLNAEEVMTATKATAARVMEEAKSPEQQIDRAFRLAIGRGPSAKERALTQEFLATCSSRGKEAGSEISAIDELCRTLFNLNAFVYVD
ncbi:MAG TPA: DUF1549 and DUF1553 domain-containing protein [Candidatus Limnocylindria bacterium]|nr:DUF1549 and DUF1553 domain-containing protein [Candidatus Limnocylindria bacterium]